MEFANKLWENRIPARRFDEIPDLARGDFDSDLAFLLERVKAVGAEHVCVVDLTKKEIGIPVVRLMVPGLELDPEDAPDYALGERALRFQQSLTGRLRYLPAHRSIALTLLNPGSPTCRRRQRATSIAPRARGRVPSA
jgi:hypothetical protein